VRWWVHILPEVVSGIQSFGFTDPPPDKILEAVEQYLSAHGESCAVDRWKKCPDDFFIYTHLFLERERWHALEFIVKDTAAVVGVLEVVWVEHHSSDSG
jgi:hypothetical protein